MPEKLTDWRWRAPVRTLLGAVGVATTLLVVYWAYRTLSGSPYVQPVAFLGALFVSQCCIYLVLVMRPDDPELVLWERLSHGRLRKMQVASLMVFGALLLVQLWRSHRGA
jgi:hypothetical protein